MIDTVHKNNRTIEMNKKNEMREESRKDRIQ